MKYFKILPAAAGVIALTATIAFARDQREAEENYVSKIKVASSDLARADVSAAASMVAQTEPAPIYLVEVVRENNTRLLSIDAYTGRILKSHDISA